MSDPRRRERASRFLDILEKKKTESYECFLEVLEEYYPHLYLSLIDWEEDPEGIHLYVSQQQLST